MSLGRGVLKGLFVTFKNAITSYTTSRGARGGVFTEQYPEERPNLPENSRQFPFLVFDGEDSDAGIRCTACLICEQECPPQCIHITELRDENGKKVMKPAAFDIDMSICMSCQICAEVCPFEAIRMDCDFELSEYGRFEQFYFRMDRLLKPNTYYHQIKPHDATVDDAAVQAREEKKRAAEERKRQAALKKAEEAKAKAAEAAKAKAEAARGEVGDEETVAAPRPTAKQEKATAEGAEKKENSTAEGAEGAEKKEENREETGEAEN